MEENRFLMAGNGFSNCSLADCACINEHKNRFDSVNGTTGGQRG